MDEWLTQFHHHCLVLFACSLIPAENKKIKGFRFLKDWFTTLNMIKELSVAGRTDSRQLYFLKVRTEFGELTESRQTESGHTDTGQNIRTESGH